MSEPQPLLATPEFARDLVDTVRLIKGAGPPFTKSPAGLGITLPAVPPVDLSRNSAARFIVYTANASGSAGSSSAQATFTYDIYSDSGLTSLIASSVAYEHRRPVCKMLSSRDGHSAFARLNSGTWVLILIPDEVIATAVCE